MMKAPSRIHTTQTNYGVSVTNIFYEREFDFFPPQSCVEKAVCIHFVPRSGSNLLADLIYQTGALGLPLEYFSRANFLKMRERLGGGWDAQKIISARTGNNGVFSFKWNSNFHEAQYFLKIDRIPTPTHHIFLDRLDRGAQSQSFARAKKTNVWIQTQFDQGENAAIPLRYSEVLLANMELNEIRVKTGRNLNATGMRYLPVFYENITEDPRKTLHEIFDFCDVAPPAEMPVLPKVVRRSSQTTRHGRFL